MGFNSVYKSLKELFPQIDTNILIDIAIEHPNDADEAAEAVFLSEIVPFLSPNFDDYFTQPENESSENLLNCKVEPPEEGSLSLSQWLNPSKVPQSYLALLNEDESSTLTPATHDEKKTGLSYVVEKVIVPSRGGAEYEKKPDYVVEKIILPTRGAAGGVGGVRTLFSASDKTGSSSSSMVKPSIRVQSRAKDEISGSNSKVPVTKRSSCKSKDPLFHAYSERLRSWKKRSNNNRYDFSYLFDKHTSKQSNKSYDAERKRKQRIDDNIKALGELLPNETKKDNTPESIMDDITAHVKLLQLQLKDLSRSRLGGEVITHPMTYIEGYGHYIHHEKTMMKSLEEEMADLLVNDFDAAASLLESKGLYLVPLSSVQGFC